MMRISKILSINGTAKNVANIIICRTKIASKGRVTTWIARSNLLIPINVSNAEHFITWSTTETAASSPIKWNTVQSMTEWIEIYALLATEISTWKTINVITYRTKYQGASTTSETKRAESVRRDSLWSRGSVSGPMLKIAKSTKMLPSASNAFLGMDHETSEASWPA